MTNEEVFRISMAQSAMDMSCDSEDYLSNENKLIPLKLGEHAKKYYKLPIGGNFISYGSNVVVAATEELTEVLKEYIDKFEYYHCFETPSIYWLNRRIEPLGYTVCFMAEYYLPDMNKLTALPCEYEMKVLEPADFADLYQPEWSNALYTPRKHLDVLAVGAYDGDKLIGLSGCSADADEMWQIGVDVLPEYRRKGVASAVTSRLALEIVNRGKVPFYCSAWSNIRSVRNAIKSSLIPAWAEMTIKPISTVNEING